MATALTAIHGAGVIHRDLKPANVLLAPGAPNVSLRDAKSCAAIWFRYLHPQGYQLSICPTGYALFNHRDVEQEQLTSHPMAIKVDQTFKVGIVLQGDQMSFFHNGLYEFSAKDGTYLRGRVGLGVGLPIVAKDSAMREVLYRNIKIWTLPSSQP